MASLQGSTGYVKLLDGVTAVGAGSAQRVSPAKRVFQASGATTAGTGTAVIEVQVSLDPDTYGWVTLGTITLTLATTPSTDGFVTDAPWPWIRGFIDTGGLTGTGAAVTLGTGT